jgi:hypothetical protein
MFEKTWLAIGSRCGRAQAVTTLVRYAGNVTCADHYNQIRWLPDEMNHRGSGVTEDSSAKYAKRTPKVLRLRRASPAAERVRGPLLPTLQESISVPIAEIGGLEKI